MSDRLLFLERYLMENTDEDTTVTTMDILEAYEKRGFRANRNTIPNDIRKLQEAGIRVECKRDVSTKCYYIAERLLSVAELRTLILRHDKKEYKVSPMVIIWNDRYYARCIDPDKPI